MDITESTEDFSILEIEEEKQKTKMAGKQMTPEEMMTFMVSFKETIEKTMTGIGKEINNKIDEKLVKLDRGISDLTAEVRNNEEKQEEKNKKFEKTQGGLEQEVRDET